ncbi:hypothetical protein BLIF_0365 [Bifidobacterium longum subsp. infantis 157F]|nr:hypothetical protein BLIF_0365 [Bifidobacterium longum subsp. infantis 157F]
MQGICFCFASWDSIIANNNKSNTLIAAHGEINKSLIFQHEY